jgi:aminoglycoside phosphotransferase (APT) family kinase protein
MSSGKSQNPTPTIDVPLVQRLVASQFPQWANLEIVQIYGGHDNRTFRLGSDLSVRLPSKQDYVAAVQKEHRWLPLLAKHLPVPIPTPVAIGKPNDEYPWVWSVNQWLPGEVALGAKILDSERFALDVAQFLTALSKIDATDGPVGGEHNFYRGASISVYDQDTRDAIAFLGSQIDKKAVEKIWDETLASHWENPGIWVHGDFAPLNLLVQDGKLSAVIDFGTAGVGDPACDLVIAWTFLSGRSRQVFREAVALDDATWARARGWALWKALILMHWNAGSSDQMSVDAPRVLAEVLKDFGNQK